jgi:tetratricopeptide (TPR) repeat protein
VAADLAAVGVQDPFSVLSLHVGDGEALREYSSGARIQTDDRNALEFSAPRSVIGGNRIRRPDLDELRSIAARSPASPTIRAALASATAGQWLDRGRMQLQAAAYDTAYEDFSRAADMNPSNPEILQELVRAAGGSGREHEAITLLDRLSSTIPEEPVLYIARSRLLASLGSIDSAISAAEQALAMEPASLPAREHLASLLTDAGDAVRLAPILRSMARDAPQHAATRYYAAAFEFLRQDFAAAVRLGEQAVAADPTDSRAQNLLGAAHASLGRFDAARSAFRAAERAAPQDPRTQVNLGILALRSGSAQDAVQHFASALALDPDSPGALTGLADALERQGHLDRARRLR